jgi:hypothetical protein
MLTFVHSLWHLLLVVGAALYEPLWVLLDSIGFVLLCLGITLLCLGRPDVGVWLLGLFFALSALGELCGKAYYRLHQ